MVDAEEQPLFAQSHKTIKAEVRAKPKLKPCAKSADRSPTFENNHSKLSLRLNPCEQMEKLTTVL